MAALRQTDLWRQATRSRLYALFLVTVALCLVRARDQPSLDLHLGGTTVSIVPADVALAALIVAAIATLKHERVGAWDVIVAAGAFCALILATAAANGMDAFVSAGKLVALAGLGLGALALVRTRGRLEALVDLLIVFTAVADVVALVEFGRSGGGRQASFLGEHDFAALATMPLAYGLALVFEGRRGTGRRAALAIVVGAIGVSLGAALASLVGLYLSVAVLVAIAAWRRQIALRPLVVTAAVVAVVTAGTLTLRSGELGFLQEWLGKPAETPGQYAASWSQRLIYAYVGGRVFLGRPVLGTGWWGELPPREFARYLPDARRRFADQPPRYFPPRDRPFVPQQAYDQVLYELGLAGAAALLALFVTLLARCVTVARRARERLAYLPAAWLASLVGALAGGALFGGSPLTAVFWLTAGTIAVAPLLIEA